MEKHTYKSLLQAIKAGSYAPIYWLEGDEPFFIDQLSDALRSCVVPEAARDFNQWVLYGKDISIEELLVQAKQFPIGTDRKLFVLRQAQQMSGWQQKDSLDRMSAYLQSPAPFSVLVFCIQLQSRVSFLQNRSFRALLKKHAVCFQSKKVYDYQLPNWALSYATEHGHQLTPKAAALLSESIGNDLQALSHELDKLMLSCPKGAPIEDSHIEQQVGISKEFNIFELQKAIGTMQRAKAYQITNYLSESSRTPAVLLLGMLFQYFQRLAQYQYLSKGQQGANLASQLGVHPYFLQEYKTASGHYPLPKIWQNIHIIHNADLKIKGLYGYSPRETSLLKEVIHGLMH